MQKASPAIMVLILIATAIFLSVRSPQSTPAPPTTPSPLVQNTPTEESTESVKSVSPSPAPIAKPDIAPRPWPQAQSDILPDSKAIFGSLANGFRYVIYPNSEPPSRVSLRLHIDAGSLMEANDQRGLAHFLEHMMFNGSKNYSADDLIPRMQRLGIAFGAHANAYTSFDETVYMLDLPELSEEILNLGFTVLRDFSDGALLSATEIDKERGVILSEKISRDTVGYRIMEQQFTQLLPDSLISHRFPIGINEVIQSAPRERFVDFYQKYYIPQRMTFVVVGDIDPAAMQRRIESTFSSMTNPENPGSDPELGSITSPSGIQTAIFHDKEVTATDVSLLLARPYKNLPDTQKSRADRSALEIAHLIMDRRFERLSKEKNSPITEGSTDQSLLFNALELGNISITAADDRWQDVVPILESEFRRAIQYGFTEAELAEAKSNIINAYEQAVEQQASRKSESIAGALVSSINDEMIFSAPETNLKIAKQNLEWIDLTTCHAAFKKFWNSTGYHLVLTTKEELPHAKAELAAIYEKSRKTTLEAPTPRATQVFEYTDFGKPGSVSSQKEFPDLGITQMALSNKVRVNLKPTDFEKGKIRILARIGSGQLSQPQDKPMLDAFAQALFEGGGLGKHSNDDLQRILAGKNVSSSLIIDEDAFTLTGSTTPADFSTQCQYMCASITDPGYREEAFWQFQKSIPMLEQQFKHTPSGPSREITAWLHGGDSRFTLPSAKQLASYTIEDAKQWLSPELTKGYLELTIVGDFSTEKILPDLLATFGALKPRADSPLSMNDSRRIKFPNAPAAKTFTYQSKIPQAIATTIWKTHPMRGNPKEFRRLNVLADILQDRLREEIREKLGASYSPNAGADGSDALDNMGYIITQSIGKPEDIELLINTMRDLADVLASKGANADELDRSLKPILGILDKSKRDNNYWLSTVMSQSQADPQKLDLARTRDADYHSISLQEINALAKQYLSAENALAVSIKPE